MMIERGGEDEDKRARFRAVSEEWFRFLGLTVSEKSRKRGRSMMEDEMIVKKEMMERREWLKQVNLDKWLKKKMCNEWAFRGEQKDILELVKSGTERVMGIMRTEGGKSMIFMFWGWLDGNGMTVVVVPLSGTVPVAMERRLMERMKMREEDVTVVRGETGRKELVW